MESLQSGVILKLLEDMSIKEKTVINDCHDCKKPALLQIRSIIPVLAEGDLWPKQGFFMEVSDSTHAIYVSLPQEEDEMVLCNKLQLGQFIQVEKLEVAYPVPMLKGVRPIPGRLPFDGDPKDLVGIDMMNKFCEKSKLLIQDTLKARSISPSKASSRDRRASIGGQNCRIRTPDVNKEGFNRGYSRKKTSFVDKGKDPDGLKSSCSSESHSRRRSWCGTAKASSSEIPGSTVVKHEITPVRSGRYYSSNDNSNTRPGMKDISRSSKPVKSPNNGWNSSSVGTSKKPLSEAVTLASSNDKQCAGNEMLWDTLPSSLVKLGKEVLRQRDGALLAAVEALQEAAATERLLRCLSTFSELQLAKEGDQQSSINKFFKLQDYLAQCRAIVQSLRNISPLRSADGDLNSPGSIREALKVAADRKRNATTWLKAAVASDLMPPSAGRTKNVAAEGKNKAKSSKKGAYTITKQRNIGEFQFYPGLEAEKENLPHWMKGSTLTIAGNLAHSLQDECKTWFLAYIENYLDGFSNKCFSEVQDSQIAESLCRIKRLNDWLEMMEKERRSEKSALESSELESYGRVRNKLYGVLLKHVERTAMVLENMNATAEA